MQDGYVKVAARTPEVRVADVDFNTKAILEEVRIACEEDGAKVVVLPELCVTAYTCEDLFWQDALLDAAERGVARLAAQTAAPAEIPTGTPNSDSFFAMAKASSSRTVTIASITFRSRTPGWKPAPMPWMPWLPAFPLDSTGLFSGSTATMRIWGFFCFK